MFSLFSSKNQKLVKTWTKEHEQIVVLGHKVIAEYSKNNHDSAKKKLQELNNLTVDHIMTEDIEFYKLLKDNTRIDTKTEKLVHDFVTSFKSTKMALMNFLTKYSKPEAVLDEEFFNTFNKLLDVLAQRIDFEEENLYYKLGAK